MKPFSGYPCIGIAVVMLVTLSVLCTGCMTNSGQGTPAPASSPVSTPAPVSTNVNASLPYGVTISVPADWTRQDVLTGGVRDYGTTTVNIANFYSPDAIPGDKTSYTSLSVDIDQAPGTDFEKYFNNATLAVTKTYGDPTTVEAHSYTITISGYKSYELDFQSIETKGTYIFTLTKNGMYVFAFKSQNKLPIVKASEGDIVPLYKSIRLSPPAVEVTQHR
jgi:predicted  nucleic acid-binding Zn-ribbon protein